MGDAVRDAARRLRRAGVPAPRRESEWIMAAMLGVDRGGVVVRGPEPLTETGFRKFDALVARREAREPLQYIVGDEEFFGLTIGVDRRALVPRPDTEVLVGVALDLPIPRGAEVADLGTGSGCVAVALASARPDLHVVAVDVSAEALDLARENARRHGAAGRIELVAADMARLPASWAGRFHAVLSNPPYVSEEEWAGLAPEVRGHEPKRALVPGPTGLESYRALAPEALRVLEPGGWLAVELGHRSLDGAREAIEAAGFVDLRSFPDLRGIHRVLRGRSPAGTS